MFAFVAVVVALVAGFVGGALFFRKHGERMVVGAAKVADAVKTVKETTKSL